MPGPLSSDHDGGKLAGHEPHSGHGDRDTGQPWIREREGDSGPAPEATPREQMIGRLGQLFGPAPSQFSVEGAGVPGTGNLAPAGLAPDPSTGTGVVYTHAGQEEIYPDPGPTRYIESNLDQLLRGQGADPPHLVHIVHHVTHTVEEGNAWWSVNRMAVPTQANGGPIRIVGANAKRTRLTIVNTDASNSIDLFTDSNGGAIGGSFGFPVPAGASLDLRHTREVWAMANTANVTIAVKSEFSERPGAPGGGEQ